MRPFSPRQLIVAGCVVLYLTLVAVVADAQAGRAQARAAICSVFGARCQLALEVARCETGGTFYSRSVGDAGERGLFQIHPVHFGWVNESRLFEPLYNARIAFRLSHGGRDWSPWSCRP